MKDVRCFSLSLFSINSEHIPIHHDLGGSAGLHSRISYSSSLCWCFPLIFKVLTGFQRSWWYLENAKRRLDWGGLFFVFTDVCFSLNAMLDQQAMCFFPIFSIASNRFYRFFHKKTYSPWKPNPQPTEDPKRTASNDAPQGTAWPTTPPRCVLYRLRWSRRAMRRREGFSEMKESHF